MHASRVKYVCVGGLVRYIIGYHEEIYNELEKSEQVSGN